MSSLSCWTFSAEKGNTSWLKWLMLFTNWKWDCCHIRGVGKRTISEPRGYSGVSHFCDRLGNRIMEQHSKGRGCLLMQETQETWVWLLGQEDPTSHRAAKPMHQNCWACALKPRGHNYWPMCHSYWSPHTPEPVLHHRRSHHNERPTHRNWRAAPTRPS